MPTCLVVDDSKVIRKVARHILESLEFEVVEAVDGSDALEQCQSSEPDVVLLDWNMPVMGGMDFLRALRGEGKKSKVIFCTTENGIPQIEAAIAAGADEFVMKPFDRDMLQSKLQMVGAV
ncbi:response regulator [Novosphingopyxis sp. YJ-S2-01]|uniref:response regulator n=1 Tax=Novosphingopyxis sp. YJ-S2-01 TaxID=2794021 RepID=UPI0018DBF577|nr:response regulator [Novosphingopyxis sp. YJ-S2-01]MBH9538317.1 response regulator [Novosphingopyxis sp. YJ-S2-01]